MESSRPLQIAVITTAYDPWVLGGAERSVKELCDDLTGEGHTVLVLTLGPLESGLSCSTVDGVRIIRRGSSAFLPFERGGRNDSLSSKVRFHLGELARLATYAFLVRELARFSPDVVHMNNIAGFGWMAWLAAGKYPSVHTLRDYYLCCMNSTANHGGAGCVQARTPCRIVRSPFRFSPARPTVFAGVSNRTIELHREAGALRRSDLSVTVHNQPQLETKRPEHVGGRAASPVVTLGMIGRIGRDKGTWLGIQAFQQARELLRPLDIQLRVAGSGSERDLIAMRGYAEADSGICFLGTSNAFDFFEGIDLALVPTQWEEPFGRSAAEALLSGVVLLASRAGGLPEVTQIYGGRFALISDYKNEDAWRDAILAVAVGKYPLAVAADPAKSSTTEQYVSTYAVAMGAYTRQSVRSRWERELRRLVGWKPSLRGRSE